MNLMSLLEKGAEYNKMLFGALSIPFAQELAEHVTVIATEMFDSMGFGISPRATNSWRVIIGALVSAVIIGATPNMTKPEQPIELDRPYVS